MTKSYYELRKFKTFEERYKYLKLKGSVGKETFGFDRFINQMLYRSRRWTDTRNSIIIRDNACDLGVSGYEIYDKIIIHHINPISKEDIEDELDIIFDPDNLITTSHRTHMAIHYGDENLLYKKPVVRYPGDTIPWL